MSLLTIIRDVAGRLSLPQPTAVVTSTDKQVIQLLALANEEGRSLASRTRWQALTAEQTFATVAGAVQPAALPDDFDRFIDNSFFNRSTRRAMTGPVSPRQWQWIQAQPAYSTAWLMLRQRTGEFLITPTPAAGQTIAYEYISRNWVISGGGAEPAEPPAGTPLPGYLGDADTSFLDEELIGLGLRWRFLRAKGLDYAEELATYEQQVEQAIARDGGAPALSISPGPIELNRVNLPDSGFGS